jgi:hypothetical protein
MVISDRVATQIANRSTQVSAKVIDHEVSSKSLTSKHLQPRWFPLGSSLLKRGGCSSFEIKNMRMKSN